MHQYLQDFARLFLTGYEENEEIPKSELILFYTIVSIAIIVTLLITYL